MDACAHLSAPQRTSGRKTSCELGIKQTLEQRREKKERGRERKRKKTERHQGEK